MRFLAHAPRAHAANQTEFGFAQLSVMSQNAQLLKCLCYLLMGLLESVRHRPIASVTVRRHAASPASRTKSPVARLQNPEGTRHREVPGQKRKFVPHVIEPSLGLEPQSPSEPSEPAPTRDFLSFKHHAREMPFLGL